MTLAINLQKVVSWNWIDNDLVLKMPSPFILNMIKQESTYLSQTASDMKGSAVKVKAELVTDEELGTNNQIDEQINLIKQIFRGHIIKGGNNEF